MNEEAGIQNVNKKAIKSKYLKSVSIYALIFVKFSYNIPPNKLTSAIKKVIQRKNDLPSTIHVF